MFIIIYYNLDSIYIWELKQAFKKRVIQVRYKPPSDNFLENT